MKSLVIGMGIGQLYKEVLSQLGHEVVTVDSDINKRADFPTVESAIIAHSHFDTAHICTPNFTHEAIAYQVAPHTKIVFIEKPGVLNSDTWKNLLLSHQRTRFMMVKNNQWRENIPEMQERLKDAVGVNIVWINYNRVPNPGSWFTNKELAYGGVSRDLMPHLLSIFMALEPLYENATLIKKEHSQNWQLKDVLDTEYGVVNPDGVYNVDDQCIIEFGSASNCYWHLNANWRSMDIERGNDVSITFSYKDKPAFNINLGLCPGEAYFSMIKDALKNINNPEFWKKQYKQDTWIHDRIEL